MKKKFSPALFFSSRGNDGRGQKSRQDREPNSYLRFSLSPGLFFRNVILTVAAETRHCNGSESAIDPFGVTICDAVFSTALPLLDDVDLSSIEDALSLPCSYCSLVFRIKYSQCKKQSYWNRMAKD